MPLFVLARWIGREWLRCPWAWLLALAALLVGPLCSLASPLGITSDRALNALYLDSIWFLSSYCGALAAFLLLDRAPGLWEELGPLRQASIAWCAIALFGLLHAGLGLGIYRWLHPEGSFDGLGGLLCIAHWASLGAFLQRLPLPLPARAIGLTLLGWWIPALLAGSEATERLVWLLGPARHLGLSPVVAETSLGVLADTMPIVAWWLATALLTTRSALRR